MSFVVESIAVDVAQGKARMSHITGFQPVHPLMVKWHDRRWRRRMGDICQSLGGRSGGQGDVVRTGALKGMVCAYPSEARLIEELSENNVGFRANDNDCDSKEVTESMID